LLLVGDGPDANELKELGRTLQLRNIHFLPAQPVEKMPAVYASADLLVFPTMEDVWGLVANEAVLCGLPVLCSKYAGCAPELFDADAIFDPRNTEEFVGALRRAVAGNIPLPDRSRLMTTAEVARKMADAVRSSTTRNGQRATDALGNTSVPSQP
jgi:glycosyltransferase involved in cell wall biosynthesis